MVASQVPSSCFSFSSSGPGFAGCALAAGLSTKAAAATNIPKLNSLRIANPPSKLWYMMIADIGRLPETNSAPKELPPFTDQIELYFFVGRPANRGAEKNIMILPLASTPTKGETHGCHSSAEDSNRDLFGPGNAAAACRRGRRHGHAVQRQRPYRLG